EIHVLGRVMNLDDLRAALDAGADALYVPAESELMTAEGSSDDQLESLLVLAEAAAGKTVTIEGSMGSVSMPALLRAAQRADITFAAPMALGPDGFQQLREYVQEVREELMEQDADFGDIRFAA